MRSKLSTCRRKARFTSEADALAAIRQAGIPLRLYRCDRGDHLHLTSRTKGKWLPQPANRPI